MKIAITGGAGYIGSHLASFLNYKNFEVFVFDKNINQNIIEDYATIKNWNILKSLDKKLEFDIVIHLAAETKVHNSVLNPKIYYDTNVIGTYNVIENLQCEYFINVSSGSAFQPQNSPYAMSKYLAESIVKKHHKNSINLRLYNVSGNNGFFKFDIERYHLIRKAAATANGLYPHVEIYGDDYDTKDGTAIRNYTHIKDIVNSIYNIILQKPITNFECLGSKNNYSVLEIIKIMEKISGKKIKKVFKKRRLGDSATSIINKSLYFNETNTIHDQCLSALSVEID